MQSIIKINHFSILLALLFLTLNEQPVYAQPNNEGNHLSISSSVPSASMTVCKDTVNFSFTLSNDSVHSLKALEFHPNFPVGLNYIYGSQNGMQILDTTGTSPIFYIDSISAGSTKQVSLQAFASCISINNLQDSVVQANQPIVYYQYLQDSFYSQENNPPSFQLNYPDLSIQVTNNKDKMRNVGDTLTRILKICNGGLGKLAHFSLIKNLEQEVKLINYQLIGSNEDTILYDTTAALDFHTSLLTHLTGSTSLNESECLQIKETVLVQSCSPDEQSNYAVIWGCGPTQCNAGNNNAITNTNVSGIDGEPNIRVWIDSVRSVGFGDSSLSIFEFDNVGQSGGYTLADMATDVEFQFKFDTSQAQLFNFKIYDHTSQQFIPLSNLGLNPVQTSSGIYQLSFKDTFTSDPDGNGGFTDADNDGFYDDLPDESNTYIKLNINTKCPSGNAYSFWNNYGQATTLCNDGCKSYSNNNLITSNPRTLSASTNRNEHPEINGPSDVRASDTVTFSFCQNQRSIHSNIIHCSDDSFYSKIMIPTGYQLADTIARWLSGNDTTGLIATQSDSLVTVKGGDWDGCIQVKLTLQCNDGVVFGFDSMRWKSYYQCSGTCPIQLADKKTEVYNHVRPCIVSGNCQVIGGNGGCGGVVTTSFNVKRTTFGYIPPNTFYSDSTIQTANKVDPDSHNVNINAVFPYDTVLAVARGVVIQGVHDSVGIVIRYTAPQHYQVMEFLNGYFIVDGQREVMRTPGYQPRITSTHEAGKTTYRYYFNIPRSQIGPLGVGYGDSVNLFAYFKVRKSSSNQGDFELGKFRAEHMSKHNGERKGCESWGQRLHVYDQKVSMQWRNLNITCSKNKAKIKLRYVTNDKDKFPNEFRSLGHFDTLTVFLPKGFSYQPGSSVLTVNAPHVVQVNIQDPTIINDTILTWVRKEFWPLQDEAGAWDQNQQNISFKLTSSCQSLDQSNIKVKTSFSQNDYAPSDHKHKTSTSQAVVQTTKPNLKLNTGLVTQDGYNSTIEWQMRVCNNTDTLHDKIVPAYRTWINFTAADTNLQLLYVIDANTNDTLPATFHGLQQQILFAQLDTVAKEDCRNIKLIARYSSCSSDSVGTINVATGWRCSSYPKHVDSIQCNSDVTNLKLRYKEANLQMTVDQLWSGGITYCDTAYYETTLLSSSPGTMYDVKFEAKLSAGVSIVENKLQYQYIDTTQWQNLTNGAYAYTDSSFFWNLGTTIFSDTGFVGTQQPNKNKVKVRVPVTFDCSYQGTEPIQFKAQGVTNCGQLLKLNPQSFVPPVPTSNSGSDSVGIAVSVNDINGCSNLSSVKISLTQVNNRTNDGLLEITLPNGFTYLEGSANEPVSFKRINSNGAQMLKWDFPSSSNTGDTIKVFYFDVTTNSALCGQYEIQAQSFISDSNACLKCNTSLLTGQQTQSFSVRKPKLTHSFEYKPAPCKQITDTLQGRIFNHAAIDGSNVKVRFYCDSDGDGKKSSNDSYLGTTEVADTVQPYSYVNYTAKLSFTCDQQSLIAIIDTVDNCTCHPHLVTDTFEQKRSNFPSLNAPSDSTISSGDKVVLHVNNEGFTKTYWSPGASLEQADSHQTTATPKKTTQYYVTAQDSFGCRYIDSTTIYVNQSCGENAIFVANAFTPNGDGLNDLLIPRSQSVTKISYFRVYNRWGEVVFETNEMNQGWNGQYKGKEASPGVYVWVLKGKCQNGQTFTKKGNATLIR